MHIHCNRIWKGEERQDPHLRTALPPTGAAAQCSCQVRDLPAKAPFWELAGGGKPLLRALPGPVAFCTPLGWGKQPGLVRRQG